MKAYTPTKKTFNDLIAGLNRPAFLLLIAAYIGLLILIIFLITPKRDYVIVPNYEHFLYAEEVRAQVTLVGLRTFDEDDKMTLRYSVAAKLSGRLQNSVDPAYVIERFQMSSYLTTNRMYFFTEQAGNKTPVSHSYTMDNSTVERIPETFFLKIQYKNSDRESQVLSIKENILLELTNKEAYTNVREITHIENIGGVDTTKVDAKVSFIATTSNDGHLVSVRITPTFNKNYHIDMQSWIVTEDGEALPFIGVYGYSDQRSTFNQSNRLVATQLNAQSIYCHLTYYVEGEPTKTLLYKEQIVNLPTTHAASPTTTPDEEETPTPENPFANIITRSLIAGGTLVLGIAVAGTVYYIKKRKDRISQK